MPAERREPDLSSGRETSTGFADRGRARKWLAAALLIVAAALCRVAALAAWSGNLTQDRDDYLVVARQYVEHGFWGRFDSIPASFRPPLYPLVVAAILKAGGGSATLGILQVALGTATVAITLLVGHSLSLGALSLVAAALVAFDPLLIQYTTFPMTETLFTFLLILLMAASLPLVNWVIAETPLGAPEDLSLEMPGRAKLPWKSACGTGVLIGASALCRPTIWPAVGLAMAWVAWRIWRTRRRGVRKFSAFVSTTAVCAASAAVVVAPWMLRNWLLLGGPVLTTTHGGYTLLLGNNTAFFHRVAGRPVAQEWTDAQPDSYQKTWYRNLTEQMDRELGAGAPEIVQDRWMYAQAWSAIANEPRLFLRACLLRLVLFWNVVPLSPSRSSLPSMALWGIGTWYALQLILFVVGSAALVRRRDARWIAFGAGILNFTLVHLFYWSNMRMRAPVVPLLALIAAVGLAVSLGMVKGIDGTAAAMPATSPNLRQHREL
jgi:hypothetical protein